MWKRLALRLAAALMLGGLLLNAAACMGPRFQDQQEQRGDQQQQQGEKEQDQGKDHEKEKQQKQDKSQEQDPSQRDRQ